MARGREKVAAAAGIRGLGRRDFQIVTQRGRHRMELRREQSCVRSLCDSAMVFVGRGLQPRLRRNKINAGLVAEAPIFWAGTLLPPHPGASQCGRVVSPDSFQSFSQYHTPGVVCNNRYPNWCASIKIWPR